MPSKYVLFKQSTVFYLVGKYKWKKGEAHSWITSHVDYLRIMFNNGITAAQTAKSINDRRVK